MFYVTVVYLLRDRMTEVFAQDLTGKTVVDSDGADVGLLHNVTINFQTGELNNLLVTPEGTPQEQQRHQSKYTTSDQGRYMIDAGRVTSIRDHIVVK